MSFWYTKGILNSLPPEPPKPPSYSIDWEAVREMGKEAGSRLLLVLWYIFLLALLIFVVVKFIHWAWYV